MSELERSIEKVFEFFKDNFAFSIALLLVSASINIKIYYSLLFHFDVIPYITAQEIIAFSFLSLGELNILSFAAIVLLFVPLYIANTATNNSTIRIGSRVSFLKRLILNGLLTIPFYHLAELIVYYAYAWYINGHNSLMFNSAEPDGALSLFSVVLLILFTAFNFVTRLNLSIEKVFILVVVSFISFGAFASAYQSGLIMINSRSYIGATVITENDSIVSTNDFMYVGQTNGYIFHFDFVKKQTSVIPMSEVKKIALPQGIIHAGFLPVGSNMKAAAM